jgi:TatD DNase family protein
MASNRLLDTHCHLAHYPDPTGTLAAAADAGVDIVAVTNTPAEYRRFLTRLGDRRGVAVAIGLHPLHVDGAWPAQLLRFLRLLPRARWVGEIGLDFSPQGKATERLQRLAFEALLSEAQVRKRPMTVHSRGAATPLLDSLDAAGCIAVLHWFTGSVSTAERAAADGHWFSVNAAMAHGVKGKAILQAVPRQRVLLETDGPYVTNGGTPTRPDALPQVVAKLARIWDVPVADAHDVIVHNQDELDRSYAFESGGP